MTDDQTQTGLVDKETIDKAVSTLQTVLKDVGTETKEEAGVIGPYFQAFIKKMLENFCSAKMLMFFLPLFTSAFFLWELIGMHTQFVDFIVKHPTAGNDLNQFFKNAMDGFIAWCTFTVSLGGTIIVVRETFKVQKLKALNSGDKDTNEDIKQMKE